MKHTVRFTTLATALALALGAAAPAFSAEPSKPTPQQTRPHPGFNPYGPGWGSYGPGPGMMNGYGMGPGMMGGWSNGYMGGPMRGLGLGPLWALDLTPAQQDKIAKIEDEFRHKQWTLMGQIMDEEAKLREVWLSPKEGDVSADASLSYTRIGELHQQMYNNMVDAKKRVGAVLTKEQWNTLRDYWRKGWEPDF